MGVPGDLANDGLSGAHGALMIIAWLFISEFAETIAWWIRCKVRFEGYYTYIQLLMDVVVASAIILSIMAD